MAAPAVLTDPLIAGLRTLLGDRLSTASAVREHHSRGESYHAPARPDARRLSVVHGRGE